MAITKETEVAEVRMTGHGLFSIRKDTIIKEFVSYVYDFYGKGGIYDMGATISQITTATIDYLSDCLSKQQYTFCGDSLDRERVRDIMIEKFNLKEVK